MRRKVCDRFVEQSHLSVMVRDTLAHILGADQLDAWFARTAQKRGIGENTGWQLHGSE